MNSQQLPLLDLNPYKSHPVNIQLWIREGLVGPYLSLLNYWLIKDSVNRGLLFSIVHLLLNLLRSNQLFPSHDHIDSLGELEDNTKDNDVYGKIGADRNGRWK